MIRSCWLVVDARSRSGVPLVRSRSFRRSGHHQSAPWSAILAHTALGAGSTKHRSRTDGSRQGLEPRTTESANRAPDIIA